jgi:hypothetical protein
VPVTKACFIGHKKQGGVGRVAAIAHEPDRDSLESGFEQRFHIAASALAREPRLDHRRV